VTLGHPTIVPRKNMYVRYDLRCRGSTWSHGPQLPLYLSTKFNRMLNPAKRLKCSPCASNNHSSIAHARPEWPPRRRESRFRGIRP